MVYLLYVAYFFVSMFNTTFDSILELTMFAEAWLDREIEERSQP